MYRFILATYLNTVEYYEYYYLLLYYTMKSDTGSLSDLIVKLINKIKFKYAGDQRPLVAPYKIVKTDLKNDEIKAVSEFFPIVTLMLIHLWL